MIDQISPMAQMVMRAAARGREPETCGAYNASSRPETPEQIRLDKITPSNYQMIAMGLGGEAKRSVGAVLLAGRIFRNASDGAAWAGLHPSTFNQAVRLRKPIMGKYEAIRLESGESSKGMIDMRGMSKVELVEAGEAFRAAEAR